MKRLLASLAALLIALPMFGQEKPPATMSADAAAKIGLRLLLELAKNSPESVGVKPAEAERATLGAPINVFFVPLDRLQKYTKAMNPESLLMDIHTRIYPAVVAGRVRSTITVTENPKTRQWELVSVGEPALAMRIAEVRNETHRALVRVPALNVYFLEGVSKAGMTLTPLQNVAGTELRVAKAVSAADAFAQLVERARRVNPDLPT